MSLYEFSRTELLLGEEGVDRLKNSKVIVFGVGGVGSFVVEALTRSGVGNLILVDNDTICISNLNRKKIRKNRVYKYNALYFCIKNNI